MFRSSSFTATAAGRRSRTARCSTASSSALDALFSTPPGGAAASGDSTAFDGEYAEGEEPLIIGLEDLPGVDEKIAERLIEAGLDSTEALLGAGVEGLSRIEGLDEETAKKILHFLEGEEV